MKRLLLVLVWTLLSTAVRAQTIECVGTESSPSQLTSCGSATKYAYKVTAAASTVDTVFIGTHDGNPANYTNICKPAGWTFEIVTVTPSPLFTPSDHRPKTDHGTVTASTGLCPFMIKFRGESQPIAPLASYTFGFDHVKPPHDVEWRVSGGQHANWTQPVGGGPGPVHAPDSTCERDSILMNSGLGVSPPGTDPNWSVVYDPMHPAGHPAASVVQSIYWGAPEPNSQWIAAEPTDNDFSGLGGYSEFQFCFCLDSVLINPTLQIGIRVDNFAEVFLNNALILSVQTANAWLTPPTYTTVSTKSSFFAGRNCIRVKVRNQTSSGGSPTPTGVNIVGWVTQDHRPGVGPGDCCDTCIKCYADGDINGDGIPLAIADYVALSQYILGSGPAPVPLCRADLNGDGFIDEGDAEVLKCYFTYGVSCLPGYPIATICHPDTIRGACCEVDTCHIRSQVNCELRNGLYFGDATRCTTMTCWGTVCGTKFEDLDGDGFQDPGEPPLGGVTISFVPSVSGVTNPVTTDPTGNWCFGPMPAGAYTIHETVPIGMVQTAPSSVFIKTDVDPRLSVWAGAFGNEDTCVSALQHLDTCLAGSKDNFLSNGAELAAPSPALCAILNSAFPLGPLDDCNPSPLNCSEFDCAVPNRGFGHTFTGCWDSTCTVVHAWLHLRVRSSGVGSTNDGLGLYQNGVGLWGVSFSTLDPTWPANVLDTWLYLEQLPASPSYPGITNVLAALQDGDLDVIIQDDTEVDFLELLVTTCCHCVPPPDSMVAWWPLDETSGPTAFDLAGLPNNGTWMDNPTPVQGKVSGALDFHSNIQYDHVTVDDQSEINFGYGGFSIDAWVKIRNQPNLYLIGILDKLVRSGPNYTGYALSAVTYGSAAYLDFLMGDGGSAADLTSNPVIPYDTWTHVAVTVSRTTGLTLYIDGSPVVSSGTVPLGSVTNGLPLLIGASRQVGAVQAPIAIDEVELFNRALNPLEIYSIWSAGSLGKCKPCCNCPHQGDINGDGVIDVFDVIGVIGVAFSGDPDPQDPCCPLTRGDVNGDGVTDVFDVIYLIATTFSGGPAPVDPCP